MIYLLGISEKGEIVSRLCSVYDVRLLKSTHLLRHWAGRNSRGVAQFIGSGLTQILCEDNKTYISPQLAEDYLQELIAL